MWAVAVLPGLLAGCLRLGFERRATTEEIVLKAEIRAFYGQVQQAFAAGTPRALAALFSPTIARPMSHAEILAWAERFFSEHGHARFRVERLEFDELGHLQALVTLTYRVETPGGRGDFGGTEQDTLVKTSGRWTISAWEK